MNPIKWLTQLPDYKGGPIVPKPEGKDRISRKMDRDFDELSAPQSRREEKRRKVKGET